ncbi:MAG: thiP [Actinomycetia bacterium]|nr:thiP [Actinomycetes bacterium]
MDQHRAALNGAALNRSRLWRLVCLLVPLAFLGLFFAYPVASIIGRGLGERGHLDPSPVLDVVRDSRLRSIAWFTTWQAFVSTVCTFVVAWPLTYVVARSAIPGRRWLRAFVIVPFVMPTVVVAIAFLALLQPDGPLGFLGWERGVAPILLAHVFFNVAVVVRTVGTFWEHLDPRTVDAARVLGASRLRAFVTTTLPLLAPAIAAAASIVFLFTFTSFGVVLLLGGAQRATLEVEIYRQTARLLDLRTAAGLALAQMVAIVVLLAVTARLQERRATTQRLVTATDGVRRPRGSAQWVAVLAAVAGTGVFLGAPLVVLVVRSFSAGGHFTLAHYRALASTGDNGLLFVPAWQAVRNSLVYALEATAIAVVVGGLAAVAIAARPGRASRAVDVFIMLPLGTSAVTVGFGFLIALDRGPLDLRTSVLLVPIAHAIVAIPFVVRAMVPVLRSIDPRLREAARVLGASPARVWREIDLPVVLRAVGVAAGFAAAVSLGEFGATVFIARPDTLTIPVAIYRLLGRPGGANFGQAMALSTLLMAVTALVVLLMEGVRPSRATEF